MEITYSFFIIRFSMKGNFDRLILLMRVHASVIREVDAINRAIFGFSLYRLGTPRAIMINFVHFIESYENAQ